MKYTYPKGEIVWVSHYDKDGNLRYITTSKPVRDYYFLYELKDKAFVKLGKDRNPSALEDDDQNCLQAQPAESDGYVSSENVQPCLS